MLFQTGMHTQTYREDDIPGQPQAVTLKTPEPGEIEVSWFPPANPEIIIRGYRIGWGKQTPDDNELEVDAATLNTKLTNLEPDTQYVVSILALNNLGPGLPFYEVIFTLPDTETGISYLLS